MAAQTEADYADIDGNKAPGVAGFKQMRAAGVRLLSLQVVYGGPAGNQYPIYYDQVWKRDRKDALDAGLLVQGYLFGCVPQQTGFCPDPTTQADALCDALGNIERPEPGKPPRELPPCIDIEQASNKLAYGDQYYNWFLKMAKRVRERLGAWPAFYASARVWQEYMLNHLPGQFAACPPWIAKPWPWAPNTPAHMDGAPTYQPKLIPQFGNAWASYQYQGDATGVPGISHTADLSRINVVGPGASGQWVMWIQARAGGLTIDGKFGPATKARIQELQALYKLPSGADGIVGAETIALLMWLNPAPL